MVGEMVGVQSRTGRVVFVGRLGVSVIVGVSVTVGDGIGVREGVDVAGRVGELVTSVGEGFSAVIVGCDAQAEMSAARIKT